MIKKKFPNFSICIHYRDTDLCIKEIFETEISALDWFDNFLGVNKRPVTVTFYCGCTPYWVYRYE